MGEWFRSSYQCVVSGKALVSSPQCDDTAPNELLEDAIQCTKGQLWGDGEQQ